MRDDDASTCKQFDQASWLLISEELDAEARRGWHQHLAECGECASLLATRRHVLDVYDSLASVPETASAPPLPVVTRRHHSYVQPALALAASLLLLIAGAFAGRLMWSRNGGTVRESQQRVNELEIELAVARIARPTAAERLGAIGTSAALIHRDPRLLDALLDVLESDPSPNVRIAAIDALYTLEPTTRVAERFDTLLSSQPSPTLRIALIEMAADRRLTETVRALKRVAAEPGNEAVRARARWAIAVLTRGA